MDRLLALVLVWLLSFPLIAPLVSSPADSAEANLPACCRRDGKHACAMRAKPGNGWHATKAVCASFPTAKATPAPQTLQVAAPLPTLAAPSTAVLTLEAQPEALIHRADEALYRAKAAGRDGYST